MALGIIALIILWQVQRSGKDQSPLVYVDVTQPTVRMMTETLSTSGTIKAKQELTLSTKIQGKVQSVLVKSGEAVQTGQRLIELESKALKLQTEIAESAHRSAASAIDEENYKRHKILYEEGVITKAEFDKIESDYKAAQADKERLASTVELQKEQASSTEITAPFDATAAQVYVKEGEVIQAGQPLALLVNMDRVEVEVPIASKNISKISEGQEAWVRVDSSPDPFNGKVIPVEQVADPISRTFKSIIHVDNKNHHLKSGMFAKVSVVTERKPQALSLPKSAFVKKEDLTGSWVYIVKEGVAHLTAVQTGLEDAQFREVLSGLSPQDQVVSLGQSRLTEGTRVQIAPPNGNH